MLCQKGVVMELARTMRDLYDIGYYAYGSDVSKLDEHLQGHGLTHRQVECYLSWVNGMLQADIAAAVGISSSEVSREINRVLEVFPHLDRVG